MDEKTIDASVKVVLFRHPFKSERDIFYAEPAVISSYFSDLPPHLALVAIRNDEKVTPESFARAGDTIILRAIPAGGMSQEDKESGGIGVVKAAGGVALLAVASVLAAPILVPILAVAGLALISTGAYRIIAALYDGTPQEKTVKGKGFQRPDIRGASNQATPDGKLPIIFGKHKIFPIYAATPFTSIETPTGGDAKDNAGQDLFLNLLFAIGYAPLKISEVKIGEVTVASAELSTDGDLVITGPYSGITGRFTNGSIPAAFPNVVKEEQVNITLEGSEYAASASPLSFTVTAASRYFDAPVGTDLNALGFKPGVMATFAGFSNAGNNGAFIVMNVTQVGGTGTNRRLIMASETTGLVNETASVSFFITPVNMVTTPKNTTDITVQLTFPQGLAKYDSDGIQDHPGLVVRAYYRAKGTLAWTLMPYFVGSSWTLTGFAAGQTIRLASTLTGLTAGEYEVRVAREEGPPVEKGSAFYDTVVWSTLQSKTGSSVCADPTNVSFLYLKVKATTALSGNLDKVSLIAESTYTEAVTGTNWTEDAAYRYSPASAFLWALTGPANPRPVPLADLTTYIDYATLVQWRDYCAATVSGAQFHTCNAVVTEGMSLQQLLMLICSTGRGFFYMKDGKYSVGWDAATTTIVQHLTPRNSWGFQWTKQFDEIPELLKIPFIDATNDWTADERLVYLDGGSEASEPKESISSWGITAPDEIVREGRYVLKCRALRPEAYTGFMDAEQLACTLGDRIEVSHDGLLVGGQWGRILSVTLDGSSRPTAIVVDEPCTMITATNYQVRIRNVAGAVLADVTTVVGENYTLTFSAPLTAGSIGVGDLYQFGEENLVTLPAIVVGIEMQDDLSAKLSLIPYNAAVFDEDAIAPPTFASLISKAPVFMPQVVGAEVDRAATGASTQASEVSIQAAAASDATTKATVYAVRSSTASLAKGRTGTVVPASVTFSGFSIVSGVTSAYAGRFKIYEDGTLKYTSSGNEATKVYSPTAGIALLVCELYKAGGTTVLLSTISLPVPYNESTAPMYLGSFAYNAFPATNIITGDWVLCNGTGGAYTKGLVYEYTGSAWTATTDSDKLNRAMSDLLGLATTDTTGPAVVFAQAIVAMNATILALQARVLYIQNVLYGGERFDSSGAVIDETKDGFHLPASGAFQFEGPDLSITKDRIRLYKGAGVQRRALQLSDESLDWLDAPDGGDESIRVRFGRLGVGPDVLIDGKVKTNIDSSWSAGTLIYGYTANTPAYSLTSDGKLRLGYRRANGDIIERYFDESGWGGDNVVNSGSSYAPCYIQRSNGELRISYLTITFRAVERIWNGTSWGSQSTINDAWSGAPSYVELESGELRISYEKATSHYIVERIWDGSAWGAETVVNGASSKQQKYKKLANGELRISYVRNSDFYIVERIWDGSAWGAETVVNNSASGWQEYYQDISGKLYIMYRDGSSGYIVQRLWNASSSSWGAVETVLSAQSSQMTTILLANGDLRLAYITSNSFLYESTLQRYAQLGAGIIEHGSNADGVYDKYSSGKLVCLIPARTLTHGTDYDWPFPFVATPDFADLNFIDAVSSVAVGLYALTATTYSPHISGGGSKTLTGIAIGRWK